VLKGETMKNKFIVTLEWNYHGPEETHYEESVIQPYHKSLKDYLPYCVVGRAGEDGIEIQGYPTLKKAILNGFNCSKYVHFDKRQKRHLHKILNKLKGVNYDQIRYNF
jgi:hypothetical protein